MESQTQTQDIGDPDEPTSPPRITQAELERYHELKQLETEKAQLRRHLIKAVSQGGEVEPGGFTIEVHETEFRRMSARTLTPILGEQKVAELKDSIPPSRSRRVIVRLDTLEMLRREL